MYCDYHVHTEFSDDSTYKIESCIKDAINLKMNEICITDHVDYGVKNEYNDTNIIHFRNNKPLLNVNYPKYLTTLSHLQAKYKNQITIKIGLEFGIQTHTIKQFQKLFNQLPLDFVILSIHQVDNQEFWTHEFQKNKTEKEFYDAYYNELYNIVINFHDYSVLGHMDLIKRYDNKDNYPSFNNHKKIITKILKYIINDGKGIEINTSSFRYQINDLMPAYDILKLYYQLGGTIITIGSDSHCKEHLENNHINEVKQTLKEIGFTHYCTFDKMKPIYHEL